ncbi:2-dehydro-3-deoxygalactonokinase [Curvibacter sp. CHRR-16]|uniref:2-dehydro-3-deoxygalactonokinase n=1 Tax=Curvibacter sp. CHRR-16 TaxID=2835872 RepID=UPI001BD97045|nr:2-dehydro-3-deoxygalactonokinase [Curvibacter sp. CHRR-16]MBT0570574.1 2-dehydro-3-deoxygalactonokinase [Curvibacter sp. CHRR-16]
MTQASNVASMARVVGVDWGTTHRRTYALDAAGQCVAESADDDGARACAGRFPAAVTAAVASVQVSAALPVVLSGMVGSALGWHEVPYLSGDVPVQDMGKHLFAVPDAPASLIGAPCVIVPGYCVRSASGQPDVMRGEETQLLGAWALGQRTGWFVLPGTHSKWVYMDDGRIVHLRTYMTGELFDLLRSQGTVAAAAQAAGDAPWDANAFAQGVQTATASTTSATSTAGGGPLSLSHLLFSARAKVVCKDMPASAVVPYLSGLLIGAELQDVRSSGLAVESFFALGSPQLAQLYAQAASLLDLHMHTLDARAAYLAAIQHLGAYL